MSDSDTNRSNKRANSGTEGDDHSNKRQQPSREDQDASQPSDRGRNSEVIDRLFRMVLERGWAWTLEHHQRSLQDVEEIVMMAVKAEGRALQFASNRLKNDKTIVTAAVQKDPFALEHASPRLQDDPEIVLKAVECDGIAFKHASDRLRNDRETIKRAVQLDRLAFYYASQEVLLADEDFLVELVILCIRGSRPLESELLTKEIALKVVKRDSANLFYLSEAFQGDRGFVLEAVKHSGLALCAASDALKVDREIVFEAVKQDWQALKHAPDQFKSDREIVVEAVKQDKFMFLDDSWKMNRLIVLEAVKRHGNLLHSALHPLRADHEIVLEAVKLNGTQLAYASTELRANADIVVEAVRQNGNALEFAAERLRGSRDVVLSAVQNEGEAIKYALDPARLDPHVLAATIRSSERFTLPKETERLLSTVIAGIRWQHHVGGGGRAVSFHDAAYENEGTAARKYAEQVWKHGLYKKIWSLKQRVRNTGVDDYITGSILECAVKEEFHLANELVRLSPIFAAFAHRGINWDGILFALEMLEEGVFYVRL